MEAKHTEIRSVEVIEAEIQKVKADLLRLDGINRTVAARVQSAAIPAVDDDNVVLSHDNIIARIREIASSIRTDYGNTSPVLISLLDGAFPFASKLQEFLSEEELDPEKERYFEFVYTTMQVASYELDRPGELNIISPPKISVVGKPVIILDDVWDTGATFAGVADYLKNQLGAASVDLAVAVNKDQERKYDGPRWLYSGFTVPAAAFLIGFGLDYSGRCRNLLDILAVPKGCTSLPTPEEKNDIAQIKVLDKRFQALYTELKLAKAAALESGRRSPLQEFTVFDTTNNDTTATQGAQAKIVPTIEDGRTELQFK